MQDRILILDGSSILYRAFFALPKLTDKKGQTTNAVYGFLLVLFKLIKEMEPKYLAVCFDFPAKTFRHLEFKEYKATRPKAPKDLVSQIPKLKEILESFSIPYFELAGYEADDLIATLVKKLPENLEKIIVSGDLDCLQLVQKNVKLYFLQRGVKKTEILDQEKVKQKYQILPEQIPDFKALVGDQSDNVPGIEGIGPKTAIFLLQKYKNIQEMLKNIKEEKFKDKILEHKEKILFNLKLVKLKDDAPIEFQLDKLEFGRYDQKRVVEVLEKYNFKSLIKRLSQLKKEKPLTLF